MCTDSVPTHHQKYVLGGNISQGNRQRLGIISLETVKNFTDWCIVYLSFLIFKRDFNNRLHTRTFSLIRLAHHRITSQVMKKLNKIVI